MTYCDDAHEEYAGYQRYGYDYGQQKWTTGLLE